MSKAPTRYIIEDDVYDSDHDLLDRVWGSWHCDVWKKSQIYETHYRYVHRSSAKAQAFEDWLYYQGAFVVQKNGLRFLRFYDENKALMFMLRWA